MPHSLSLDGGVLCVADREHGRVICWNVGQRLLQPQVINLALYGRIYAVSVTGQFRPLSALVHYTNSGVGFCLDWDSGIVVINTSNIEMYRAFWR